MYAFSNHAMFQSFFSRVFIEFDILFTVCFLQF